MLWDHEAIVEVAVYAGIHRSSSLAIIHRGAVVLEHYYAGNLPPEMDQSGRERTPEDLTDLHSTQKSVLSVLVGIARGKGLLSLDDSLTQWIGPWSRATPEQEQAITLKHALSMSAGLDDDDAYVAPPGEVWHYSLGIMIHCLKSVLEAATGGRTLASIAHEWLFEPLGIEPDEAVFAPALNDQAVNPRPIPRHEVGTFGRCLLK